MTVSLIIYHFFEFSCVLIWIANEHQTLKSVRIIFSKPKYWRTTGHLRKITLGRNRRNTTKENNYVVMNQFCFPQNESGEEFQKLTKLMQD